MAGVLDVVKPLAALIRQAAEPSTLAERLVNLAMAGATGPDIVAALSAEVVDRDLVVSALTHASVLAGDGLTAVAAVRLAQAQVLIVSAEKEWELVFTVPGFLRRAFDDLASHDADHTRPRETRSTLIEVATTARHALLIAAPFLQDDLISSLIEPVERLLRGGGTVTVITRALSPAAPDRSTANVDAVTSLRRVAERVGRRITVRSWEEEGLGLHFKTVIADHRVAYLGSANLTLGGTFAQAEAGVLLRGPQVTQLARWLDTVADELAQRRLPAS